MDNADGVLIADAVKFVPEAAAKAAAWEWTAAASGTHRVYAKWPASPAHATDAVYTVSHDGGATEVTVNQRAAGGAWVWLGSFGLTAGNGYRVELSDQATGRVAADAVYAVPAPSAVDGFTWTPVVPQAGSYGLYARWPAASANSAAASYTVVHGGGTTVVAADQRANGGQWNLLGEFAFEPGAGHRVTLTEATDGAVAADAIRLVGQGPAPAEIAYVHADHLGQPQKLTDASQAVVWDAVFRPFGEAHSIAGSATNDLRFPGQLYDGETGFHYNGQRDYDPSVGRYIESDPIGLAGGINTYAYVGGNPVNAVDPTGEIAVPLVIAGRILLAGGSNVLLGYGLSTALGQCYGFEDAAYDFAFGALLGVGLERWLLEARFVSRVANRLGTAASRIAQNAAQGLAFEQAVLKALGSQLNKGAVKATGLGKSIPDIVGPNSLTEIKDALKLANTKQLKIQTQAAIDAGKSFNLIVSPRTKVITKPLQRAVGGTGGTIQVFDPATGSLRLWQP